MTRLGRPKDGLSIPPIEMLHTDRAIAGLRVVVGLWFAKGIAFKLSWNLWMGIVPAPIVSQRWIGFLGHRIAEYAAANPPAWYKAFLLGTVIPHSPLFAHLTALGEIAVGVALTLGLVTILASFGGLWLISNYFLASLGMGFNQEGFHVLLIATLLLFAVTRAGRTWGLDGWIIRHHPDWFVARMGMS